MTDASPTVGEELKPCPFCGSGLSVSAEDIDGFIGHVECSGCDMRGPVSKWKYEDSEEAKSDATARWNAAWNRRPTPNRVAGTEGAFDRLAKFARDWPHWKWTDDLNEDLKAMLSAAPSVPDTLEREAVADQIFLYFADRGGIGRMADLDPDDEQWSLEEHLLIRAHRSLRSKEAGTEALSSPAGEGSERLLPAFREWFKARDLYDHMHVDDQDVGVPEMVSMLDQLAAPNSREGK